MLHLGPERNAAVAGDTRRLRNAVADARRTVDVHAVTEGGGGASGLPDAAEALLRPPPPPRRSLHRITEDAQPLYAADAASDGTPVLTGYGALAHFLGPAPLGSVGATTLLLPVDLRVGSSQTRLAAGIPPPAVSSVGAQGGAAGVDAAGGAVVSLGSGGGGAAAALAAAFADSSIGGHSADGGSRPPAPPKHAYLGATLPSTFAQALGVRSAAPPIAHALVTDTVLRAVAARLGRTNSSIQLPAVPTLPAFLSTHGLPVVPPTANVNSSSSALARALSERVGHVAIVSLCSYDAAKTNLTALSTRNLRAYCDAHGYACFMGSTPLDVARAPAWTKILLVAALVSEF